MTTEPSKHDEHPALHATATGNNPLLAIKGMADAAGYKHASWALGRGGALGRAQNALANGLSAPQAAALGASNGKGHMAELKLAAEFTLLAAAARMASHAEMNARSNDPVADLLVRQRRRRRVGVQVGVGRRRYIAKKVRCSPARIIVVNKEARDVLPAALKDRCSDRLIQGDVASDVLTEEKVFASARDALEELLQRNNRVSGWTYAAISVASGAESGVTSFGCSLLLQAVDRLLSGRPFDGSMIQNAIYTGADAAARTTVQTALMVRQYLDSAGAAFRARVLRATGRGAGLAGAIADVVVSTAADLVRWARGRITFEEVLRRAGINVLAAAGAFAGVAVVLPLCTRLPWWATAVALFFAGAAGHTAGRKVGEFLLPQAAQECATGS